MYDEAGHILGEYTNTGALIEETVWMGDLPVATLQPNGSSISIYYIHSDHLGTPRKITQPSSNTLAWRWDPDTFGSLGPNQNPGGLGTFIYNLRFPGQYYQAETGLMLNYFRDYDPQTGRYVESDPIGLAGGSYSTYTYVGGNPISYRDPYGLAPGDPFPSVQAAAVDALNWVYQIHPTANTEYAGTVYVGANGNYYATKPNPGSESNVQPSYGPGGYGGVQAYYHTHGQCLKGFDNDHFSTGYPQSDLEQADWHLPSGVPSFLETPGHIILKYDPDPARNQNGPITTLQSGKSCPCNASQK